MRLLIVEPNADGHYMILYVRHIVDAAVKRGWVVTLLTTKKSMHHESLLFLKNRYGYRFDVICMADSKQYSGGSTLSLIMKQYNMYCNIKNKFNNPSRSDEYDLIYYVSLDNIDKVISLLGCPIKGVPYMGMIMSPKFHRHKFGLGLKSRSDVLFSCLFKRLLSMKLLLGVTVIDEYFYLFAKNNGNIYGEKVYMVSDVGEIKTEYCQGDILDKSDRDCSRFYILVYGALSKRKGVKEIVSALVGNNLKSDVVVVLAGKQDEDIESYLQEEYVHDLIIKGRVEIYNYFHDDKQESEVFKKAHAVWVGYVDGFNGSSGVLYQAASIGVPVIATKNSYIGKVVEKNKIGIAIDPRDPDAVSDAINILIGDDHIYKLFGENAKMLSKKHTGKIFGDTICGVIDEKYNSMLNKLL